jgi:hypothetical protein
MDANGRGGEERDWVLEISDWGERRNRRNFEFWILNEEEK